ncbi:restriction endonuclease subunit S [Niveibacterium sp. 24ML]|uniref:restriction endonuclease subunit S n=1 Tax=Niveibacterium sp. 24ML TaxID=2985512 RepID=UPI0022703699|nr:restriction endonuclease subunit S [Niveibacterium sp. 24ML]MCX9157273.1 restriction endonuclease subunit S [Niveibacterium sp. 24ML]
MKELPQGWSTTTLGKITTIRTGKLDANAASPDGQFPFFTCSETPLRINSFSFDTEAVLLAGNGGFSIKWFKGKFDAYQRTYVIEPTLVHGRYLYRLVSFVLPSITNAERGSTIPYLRVGDITGAAAPLAPLPEQKRIADKLDTVLARVDACRDRLDRIPALLKRFRQSILAAATSGRLTEDWRATHHCGTGAPDVDSPTTRNVSLGEEQLAVPETWKRCTLSDLINKKRPLCYGVVQPGNEADDGVPLVRVQDMENGAILIAGLRTVSKSVDLEYKRSRVVAGDLLVSIVGTIGRTAVVPSGFEGNIARAIARIAPSANVLAQWLDCWLSTPAVQWWLLSSSREVARKTLNLAQLAETPVAVPSLDEQLEIVRRVETLFAFADRLEARLATARKQAGQLTPALLAKAFRGELVPQDPNDEPATELLKRLATQRDNAPKPKRRRGSATLAASIGDSSC